MMDDEADDRRRELCDRFRNSLSKPVAERFFDEDELVDVFDYAGDLADDYLKMEALMCGARLYPDSAALKERRAIFYSFVSPEATEKYLEDNSSEVTPIWEIMRLRARAPQGKDAEGALAYLLGGVDKLGDEEVIQFVELASQLGAYPWLLKNEKLLRQKADYAPILIYELAVVAELNHDYESAVRFLEELTEAEPFNAYYWYMLAQDLEQTGSHSRAMGALEYSLAIDPDGKEALQMRARMLLADPATEEEGMALIQELARKYPDDPAMQRTVAFINYASGRVQASREMMRRCLEQFPGDRAVLSDAVAAGVGNLDDMLDTFYANTDERDEATWLDWADDLMSVGCYAEARSVLEAYVRNSPAPLEDVVPYIDAMFFSGDFNGICRLLDNRAEDAVFAGFESSYATLLACLIACLRTGRRARAEECLKALENAQQYAFVSTADLMASVSTRALVANIQEMMRRPSVDWSGFDPFGLWSDSDMSV